MYRAGEKVVAKSSVGYVVDYVFVFGGMGGKYICFYRIFMVDVEEIGGIDG